MKIINVVMTKAEKGCPDNVVVRTYEKGKEYNLPESLARVFIDDLEVAEEVIEKVEDDGLGDETPEPPKEEKKSTRASRKAASK